MTEIPDPEKPQGLSVWSEVISVNLTEMKKRNKKSPSCKSTQKISLNSGTTQVTYATPVQLHSTGEKSRQCNTGKQHSE